MTHTTINKLINENEFENAINQIELILKQNPNDDEAYYLKGKIYQKQQQWNNAIAAYTKAIELNKNSKAIVALEILYDILNMMNNKILST